MLGSAIGAVVVAFAAIAVLSMHMVDAHPVDVLHRHGQSVISPDAVAPWSSSDTPDAPDAPDAHDAQGAHGAHGHHPAAPENQSAAVLAPAAPFTDLLLEQAGPIETNEQGHRGHGHSSGFAHHVAMCAAVILTGVASNYQLRRPRRVSLPPVRRLIGTSLGLDPPVPRLALVRY